MALVEIDALTDRLDWDLDPTELRIGEKALDDLSDDAEDIAGDPGWTVETVPRRVAKIILSAAIRYMKNPDGLVQSRAGDETLILNEDDSGEAASAHFSDGEIQTLSGLVTTVDEFGTIPIVAYGQQRDPALGLRPCVFPYPEKSGDKFMMFADPDGET